MTRPRLSLIVGDWPELDRALWVAAKAPAGFLEAEKPASRWSPARQRIGEQAYGQWLALLDRNGELDPASTLGDRATEDRLRGFVAGLQGRVAPVSVAMMVGALLRMLAVLEPQRDWATLARVYGHLKQTATPSRNKLGRMVAAADLFELGLRLMDTCEDGPDRPAYVATRHRDGLLVATLIACPMRLANLTGLVIGRHLIVDGGEYRIKLAAAETKTGRPYSAAIPPELMPYLDRWLQVYRPRLQSIARAQVDPGTHLWLSRWGRPMGSNAIRHQIEARTQRAFGKPVWPHLFRDCAVTELVDCAPEEIGITPDLLGHADLRTTHRHYIQAHGMTAHVRVQEMIARRRAAARRPHDA
jgi:integrase/recombinase XerD